MALTWTDWRGNDYTVGDTILFARMSGRSCEMAEGVIVDLMVMCYGDDYAWKRVPDGEPVPEKLVYQYVNPENPAEYSSYQRNGKNWDHRQIMVPVQSERRAKIMPTLRTSRFRSYEARQTKWVYDEKTNTGAFIDAGPRKPVTLRVTESITAIVP